jgi:hypothetical protein
MIMKIFITFFINYKIIIKIILPNNIFILNEKFIDREQLKWHSKIHFSNEKFNRVNLAIFRFIQQDFSHQLTIYRCLNSQ